MFVIRDYSQRTPLGNVEDTITAHIYRIWEEIKAEGNSECDTQFEQLFIISFKTTCNYEYEQEGFKNDCNELAECFNPENFKNFVL